MDNMIYIFMYLVLGFLFAITVSVSTDTKVTENKTIIVDVIFWPIWLIVFLFT